MRESIHRRGHNVGHLAVIGRALVLALVYGLTAALGLSIEAVGGHATLVWPPAGIALAALLLFGNRVFPGILLGAFTINLHAGAPLWLASFIAVGNTAEALLGSYALRRLVRFRTRLTGLYQVLGLILFAAVLSTLVASTVGAVGLLLASKVTAATWVDAWRTWWLGDALGILVVAPALLTLSTTSSTGHSLRRWLEIGALTLLTVASCSIVFLTGPSGGSSIDDLRSQVPALPYLTFPPLMWAAIRFGLPGAARAIVIVSGFAVYGTVRGFGPFMHENLGQSLLAVQMFVAVAAITALVLGAIVSDRTDAIRRREDFLAIVSHDLKNPLNAIMMTVEMLDRSPPADERTQRQVGTIRRAAGRMLTLIRDLLDIVAIEAGRFEVQVQTEEAGAIVREAVEMMQPIATERSHQLGFAIPSSAVQVSCNRERILQVFSNLIGNAVKFTPAGGKIAVEAEVVGPHVRFSVTDNGPGLSDRHLAHIFDRFWRANPKAGGTGLGLFIAKGIVEAHGGTIWAESAPGHGSQFLFTLPRPHVRH
jgi:signal transduction histidine kinase